MTVLALPMARIDGLKQAWKRHYPLVLLFLFMLISLSYSQDLETGLERIERAAILPVSVLIFSGLSLSQKQTRRVLMAFTILVLMACVYSHGITIAEFFGNKETELRAFFNLNYSYLALGNTLDLHPTYYALIIIAAIIVLLDQLGKRNTVWVKLLLGVGIAYLSFFIIHLSSRIGIVILYGIILHQILTVFIRKRAFVRGLILLVGFHAILFLFISQIGITKYRFQHIFGFTYYTGYQVNDGSHKLALWSEAIGANEQFLFGNGIGDVASTLSKRFESAGLDRSAERGYNSHNQYIEYYVGMGLIGAVLFLYILYFYFRKFQRANNRLGIYFIAALAVFCITECVWDRHHGIVFSVILIGILHFLNSNDQIQVVDQMGSHDTVSS